MMSRGSPRRTGSRSETCVAASVDLATRLAGFELEEEPGAVIDDRRSRTELDSGENAGRAGVRARHKAQHRSVRVRDIHRHPKGSPVIDVAMFNTQLDASIDDCGHFPCRPEHEGTYIEAVKDRPARAIFALAQPDHEPGLVIGKDDTSDFSVLKELVGQFQIEEVCVPPRAPPQITHRQLDLTDADNGQFHNFSVSGAAARGIGKAEGRRVSAEVRVVVVGDGQLKKAAEMNHAYVPFQGTGLSPPRPGSNGLPPSPLAVRGLGVKSSTRAGSPVRVPTGKRSTRRTYVPFRCADPAA
jgi:hypothetical protein